MKNKKTVMTLSALLILIFHLWINVTSNNIEIYLRQVCGIGVDLFFLVSAYFLSKKDKINYKEFILNRFSNIYLKFILFSLIAFIYFKWDILRFLKTIFGIDLFIKGGGSFLWFIPAIMIIYLLFPLYKKIDNKYPIKTPIVTVCFYITVVLLVSYYTRYTAIFIFLNRLPIILIGYYLAKYNILEKLNSKKHYLVSFILLILGFTISYYFFANKINVKYFYDIMYIIYIPLVLGTFLLIDKIKSRYLSKIISPITLELYGLQMIFGFKIAGYIYKWISIPLLSNILTIIIMIILSLLLNRLFGIFKNITDIRQKVDGK